MVTIDCRSSSFCVSTGEHIRQWNGTEWSTVKTLEPKRLYGGVSCSSSTFCIATGRSEEVLQIEEEIQQAPYAQRYGE
jgi:hypothetical protein